MDALSDRCRELDISFYPTPLFSPEYPSAYSDQEREKLYAHMSSMSQIIQMQNGLDTRTTRCHAASKVISIDLRSGNITPCASVSPSIGNVYEDRLDLEEQPMACPAAGISCLCDVHFQQDIVVGADDRAYFARHKAGWVSPIAFNQLRDGIQKAGLQFSSMTPGIGQTKTSGDLSLSKETVRARYQADIDKFASGYRDAYAKEFRSRQE